MERLPMRPEGTNFLVQLLRSSSLSCNILLLSRLEYLRQGKEAGRKIIRRLLSPQSCIILTPKPCLLRKKKKRERGGRNEDNRL